MKKKRYALKMLLLTVLSMVLLAGCGSTKLSEDFDSEAVQEKAREAVGYLVAGEYDKDVEMMNEPMSAAVTAEVLQQNMDAMNEQTGAFKEIKSIAVVGQKDENDEDYAVAVVIAEFEKRNVTYTVSFNKEMEIMGFYMK